ncbi:hypothetical protein K474DRAFT_1579301, partial [Panus rudis PR-1116 ss-1]
LVNEFRRRYHEFVHKVETLAISSTDSVVISRLGDDLQHFAQLVNSHQGIFDPTELALMRDSLGLLQHDIRLLHNDALDQSHHGRPVILTEVHTGGRGRPKIVIDRLWLEWAYGHKSIAKIARYLGVGRSTVRSALLEYGIASPQSNDQLEDEDQPPVTSYTRPMSSITDDDLDTHIRSIRAQIVIHGFIDGYSRLVVGLRASNNNRASTVLNLFLRA